LCLIIKTKLILVCNGNFAVSYTSAISAYSFNSVRSFLTLASNLHLMVHLSFHYKMTNLIAFKNLCPLKKHILQQERYSTQNCFPNHVIRILYHYSARSKHISQGCECTSLLIDCVLILNKEKTSFKPKKLQNNFIPVKMGTGCYYGPSKSRIPNCL